jgi:hypothetical protein
MSSSHNILTLDAFRFVWVPGSLELSMSMQLHGHYVKSTYIWLLPFF